MWRKAKRSRRGTLTTPTKWVIADTSSEALPSSDWVPPPGASPPRTRAISASGSGLSWSSESTKTR